MGTKYTTSEICISFFGDTAPLYPIFNQVAAQIEASEGDMSTTAKLVPVICHALIDSSISMHGVSNSGQVWNSEADAGSAMAQMYEDESSLYAGIEQSNQIEAKTDWMVVTLSFCFERQGHFDAIETSITTVEDVVDALKQLSALSAQEDCLRAFNLHWSPATEEENITDDQMIQYYPNLRTL
ncbi:MAG: DUF1517 domain-containing protein [Thermosynechococcaceae cyanobacterium]